MTLDEKLAIGIAAPIGEHRFEPDEIKTFAGKFDPQPFHLDEVEAAKSHFGRLCASGWHTVSMWMRHNVLTEQQRLRDLQSAGHGGFEVGVGLGLKNLRWLLPVYAGDTIRFSRTRNSVRASNSLPGWSIVEYSAEASNQAGDKVMEFEAAYLCRDAA